MPRPPRSPNDAVLALAEALMDTIDDKRTPSPPMLTAALGITIGTFAKTYPGGADDFLRDVNAHAKAHVEGRWHEHQAGLQKAAAI